MSAAASSAGFSFRRFLMRSLDREPMVVLAGGFAAIGVALVAVGPPVRRALGYDTRQFYGVEVHHEAKHVERAETVEFERQAVGQAPKRRA